jgi:outer membrane protein TolC
MLRRNGWPRTAGSATHHLLGAFVRFLFGLTAVAAVVATAGAASGQVASRSSTPPALSSLDAYVAEAIQKNLGLAQQRLAAERGDAAIRQVHGLKGPSVSIDARYSKAYGYVPDFGPLLNPVYQRLNELSPPGPFPTDLDLRFPLAQETRLRIAQPVYQPAIGAANQLARTQRDLQGAQIDVSARRLAADVRIAYLNMAKAARLGELYESTMPLMAENIRVNERLVANGRGTPDGVLRARAEQSEVEQQRASATERRSAARGYFNLLLDRAADTPVEVLSDSVLAAGFSAPMLPVDQAIRNALARREEFRQIELGVDATRAQERMAAAGALPSVGVALDYGVQGSEYRFSPDRDYALATITFSWNVFNGGQDAARRQQAALEGDRLRMQRREVERQITLEVMQAHESAEVARTAIGTAQARLASAKRSFELLSRRHAEGMASLVEFVDARTSFTNAGINLILTTYDYFARRVELDRAAALYPESLSSLR